MACSFITGSNSINSAIGIVTHSLSSDSDKPIFQNECQNPSTPPLDAIVKMEYEDCSLQVLCPAFQTDASGVEKTSVNVVSLPQHSLLCDVPASVKVEGSEILLSSVDNGRKTSLQIDFPGPKVKKEIPEDVDALDHVVLKERQRMLLASLWEDVGKRTVETPRANFAVKLACGTQMLFRDEGEGLFGSREGKGRDQGIRKGEEGKERDQGIRKGEEGKGKGGKLSGSSTGLEGHSGGLLENIIEHTVEKVNDEIHSIDGKTTISRDQCYEIPERSNASLSVLPPAATTGLFLSPYFASPISTKSLLSAGLQEHDHVFEPTGSVMQFDSHVQQGIMPIKNDSPITSTCPTSVKVKDEPWDNNDLNNVDSVAIGSISVEIPNVKCEWEAHNEYHHDDHVEHMSLIDRLNFIMSGEDSSLNIATSYPSLKISPSAFIASSSVSESAGYSGIKRIRKRKKTATDSVQTALEEDAPGLLQALLDKGVLVDEIKLYGESGDDEPLDESHCEDSFSELEAVISKIFSQRHSFLKIPITRATKASRASYCLACLISLVEQVIGFL
ncbi:unnamed protein product [Lupinus luteus]|uniref:Uncharacterized protein n=1 Tax=Lupinus luteus TaxID=3873 RepID=A0AAV1WE79_LUPLU